jgi:hypothetical protein
VLYDALVGTVARCSGGLVAFAADKERRIVMAIVVLLLRGELRLEKSRSKTFFILPMTCHYLTKLI